MIFGRGRGCGSDFDGRGRGFVGDGCGSYGGRQSASEKGPRQCRHNHIFEKCWKKFGRPEWAQFSESDSFALRSTPQDYSSTPSTLPGSSTVILTQEEYDRLRQLEFSQNNLSTTHASASGMHTYTASPQKL